MFIFIHHIQTLLLMLSHYSLFFHWCLCCSQMFINVITQFSLKMSPVPKMSSLTGLNSWSPQWQQYERTHTPLPRTIDRAVSADWILCGGWLVSRRLVTWFMAASPFNGPAVLPGLLCVCVLVCLLMCVCACESSCIIDVPLPPPQLGEQPPDSGKCPPLHQLLVWTSFLLFHSASHF